MYLVSNDSKVSEAASLSLFPVDLLTFIGPSIDIHFTSQIFNIKIPLESGHKGRSLVHYNNSGSSN